MSEKTMGEVTSENRRLIQAVGLSIGYGRRVLLSGIDLDVVRGQVLALVGPNGAGKTTLLHTLMGLTQPLAGQVKRLSGLRVGYVPQRGQHDPIFPLTALDVVRGGGAADGHFPSLATLRDSAVALSQVGLAEAAGTLFRQLSGGQQQRVLLARALVRKPDLLALDEPTAGMDIPAEWDLMSLVQGLAAQNGMSVLWVTHQLHLAARFAQHIALINSDSGLFCVDLASTLMTGPRLSQIFGRPMSVLEVDGTQWVVSQQNEVAP